MNFQITRIRLASVGPEPARYDPLDLDLRNPDRSAPSDTVLYLPNTGGKTVLMRLLFSVLHPPIVEKIGTDETAQKHRNIVGYVLERDTSHVIVEWRRVEEGRYADDEVLITGLVAEWRGGRPTGKPEDLVRVWYTIRGPAQLIGIDTLVFEADASPDAGAVRRRLPLRRFREQLDELRRMHGRTRLDVTVTEVQRDWVDHLDKLGLDRALFRYQGEMNHNEAGASAIARFKEDKDFIKFFLDAVFDPGELSSLDREFEEVADKVRRYPEYERRLRFEQAALAELEPLSGLVAALADARVEAERARSAAMALLAAFVGAAEIARGREETERERMRGQDAEARKLTQSADRLRDEWREFRRLGASLWLEDAKATYKDTSTRTEKAELDVRAWALTEDLARLQEAHAKVLALDEVYATEMERLRPLQDARDDVAIRLAQLLLANAVVAEGEAHAAEGRARGAKDRAKDKRNDERDALIEAVKIEALASASEERLDAVASLRVELEEARLLDALEPTRDAVGRETARLTQAEERIEGIETQSAELESERGRLDQLDREAAPHARKLREASAHVAGEIERAEKERRALADDPLVIELAELPEFDLEVIGPSIAERALGRAKQAEAARLGLELQVTEDRRAVRGLDESGLLPPAPEVEAAVARLRASGISGAIAGTHYVAEAISRARLPIVASRRADLVGGIVITDSSHLEKARSVLESANLDPGSIIAVGPAEELVELADAPGRVKTFVVPPSDAVWNRTAGGAERARREERLSAVDGRRIELEDRSAGARKLADALARHATTYPVGWLRVRIADRDGLLIETARMEREANDRDLRRTQISGSLQGLNAEVAERRQIAKDAQRRLSKLQLLLERETEVAGLAATIERQRADAGNWRVVAEEARRAAEAADDEGEREATAARIHRSTGERIRREVSTVVLANPVPDPSASDAVALTASGEDLFELRARFQELDARLSGETSASDVAARRDAAIHTRDELKASVDGHRAEVRSRAKELLSLPEAGDLAGRRAGAELADAEVVSARQAQQQAFVDREKADSELAGVVEEIKTSRRSAKIPDERMPRDRHHASLLAAQARQSAELAQRQAAAAEQERNAARDAADEAKQLAVGLDLLATSLKTGLKIADDVVLPAVAPYEGTAAEANPLGLTTSRRLSQALDGERSAEQAWRKQDDAVRAVLAHEDFAELAGTDRLYRRLTQSAAEVLARDAGELVVELRTGISVLQGELATLEEDQKLATTSLARSVNKALGYLKLAESRSKMPPRLRDWSGEAFFEIRFEKPPSDELDVRLRAFVAQMLKPDAERPSGSKFLMLALERAVGVFRVRILKPNEAFLPIRVPISELSSTTFSNGQRATVATAMMLMLSELRRRSRSAARDASVGALVLDNPLGNANAGFLIDVQRTVAAAAGIQLVYTTGIADMTSLRRFPNVIALSNDAARRTMRRYVRANPALLDLLVPPEESAGGRVTARRVVATPIDDASGG